MHSHIFNTLQWANQLWQYLRLNHIIRPADCMIVLGSHDLSVAHRAIELFKQGQASHIIFSGGSGKITQHYWDKSEARMYADIALKAGIASRDMTLEQTSSNTGENIRFSLALLKQQNLAHRHILLVCKPYFERRAYATFKQHCCEASVQVTSQHITFIDYFLNVPDLHLAIALMVGDLQRIVVYPQYQFQIKQKLPDKVMRAYQSLIELGFDQHLIGSRSHLIHSS